MANTEVQKVIKGLRDQGAVIESRGKNMRRARFTNGTYVDLHTTPSDSRWQANLKPRIEKAGAVWPLGDSKKLKAAIKANRMEANDTVAIPSGHFDHVVMPASVREYRPRTPRAQSIGLIRGALLALGNPKTFWTDEVSEILQDQTGFRGGQGNIRTAQILDWLGYRTVEAKPNRNGHSYRWALDPESDRAAKETLPIITIRREGEGRAERVVEPEQAVEPVVAPEPEVATEVEAQQPEPEPEPEPELPAAEEPPSVVVVDPEPVAAVALPAVLPVPAAAPQESDINAALALLDDAGSWAVELIAMGKDGKRLAKLLHRLGLNGELRVWRQ